MRLPGMLREQMKKKKTRSTTKEDGDEMKPGFAQLPLRGNHTLTNHYWSKEEKQLITLSFLDSKAGNV
jgi:hypothetical protein